MMNKTTQYASDCEVGHPTKATHSIKSCIGSYPSSSSTRTLATADDKRGTVADQDHGDDDGHDDAQTSNETHAKGSLKRARPPPLSPLLVRSSNLARRRRNFDVGLWSWDVRCLVGRLPAVRAEAVLRPQLVSAVVAGPVRCSVFLSHPPNILRYQPCSCGRSVPF